MKRLTPKQSWRCQALKDMGHGYKYICAITGFTRKAVIEAVGYQGEAKEQAKRLEALRRARPLDRSVEEHERVIRSNFPELVEA
jgi:hypothetical protein